jgi:hypothetical protein
VTRAEGRPVSVVRARFCLPCKSRSSIVRFRNVLQFKNVLDVQPSPCFASRCFSPPGVQYTTNKRRSRWPPRQFNLHRWRPCFGNIYQCACTVREVRGFTNSRSVGRKIVPLPGSCPDGGLDCAPLSSRAASDRGALTCLNLPALDLLGTAVPW